jgi:hypothetical protein
MVVHARHGHVCQGSGTMILSRRRFLEKSGLGLGGLSLASLAGALGPGTALAQAPGSVDAQTLIGKVLCGYQGWFRCPGDGTTGGWKHWNVNPNRIIPYPPDDPRNTLTVDMWPDMSEYTSSYPTLSLMYPDGSPASLFSSVDASTVDLHFVWMRTYGIDGVLAQRFLVGLNDPSLDTVLTNVRQAANRTGRVFAVEYDMTNAPTDQLLELLVSDWNHLVNDLGVVYDPRYLYHDGKPVLSIWGFFTNRFDGGLANQIIDAFTADSPYQVCLIGGSEWYWRTDAMAPPGSAWNSAFRRFDVIQPWNVGNVTLSNGQKYATTNYWMQDLAEAERVGMMYLPVLYPGFSWDNLMHQPAGTTKIDRLGGAFLWRQFMTVAQMRIGQAKVAMFDEVNEGTAIFKVSNTPPVAVDDPSRLVYFVTYDGLPTDWYLWLTGLGTQFVRGSW